MADRSSVTPRSAKMLPLDGVSTHPYILFFFGLSSRAKIALPNDGLCTGGQTMLQLTPPNQITFIISVVIAAIAVILHYANIAIPTVTQTNFFTLLMAYLVLLAGNLFEGV